MNKVVHYTGQLLAVVGGALLLNNIVYLLTSAMGSPTVIAGFSWALDTAPFSSPLFQLGLFGAGMAISHFFKAGGEKAGTEAIAEEVRREVQQAAPEATAPQPAAENNEPDDHLSALDRAMQAAIEQHAAAAKKEPKVSTVRARSGSGGGFGRRTVRPSQA